MPKNEFDESKENRESTAKVGRLFIFVITMFKITISKDMNCVTNQLHLS